MRNNKIWMIGTAVVVVGALLALVMGSFSDSLVYFHTPSELAAQSTVLTGKKVRIGGMVREGSLVKTPGTLKIRFLVTDGQAETPVQYDGVTPDLFREGQGVIAEGIWQPNQPFQATAILAKHSEDYVPVEMTKEGVAKSRESLLKSLR